MVLVVEIFPIISKVMCRVPLQTFSCLRTATHSNCTPTNLLACIAKAIDAPGPLCSRLDCIGLPRRPRGTPASARIARSFSSTNTRAAADHTTVIWQQCCPIGRTSTNASHDAASVMAITCAEKKRAPHLCVAGRVARGPSPHSGLYPASKAPHPSPQLSCHL